MLHASVRAGYPLRGTTASPSGGGGSPLHTVQSRFLHIIPGSMSPARSSSDPALASTSYRRPKEILASSKGELERSAAR